MDPDRFELKKTSISNERYKLKVVLSGIMQLPHLVGWVGWMVPLGLKACSTFRECQGIRLKTSRKLDDSYAIECISVTRVSMAGV